MLLATAQMSGPALAAAGRAAAGRSAKSAHRAWTSVRQGGAQACGSSSQVRRRARSGPPARPALAPPSSGALDERRQVRAQDGIALCSVRLPARTTTTPPSRRSATSLQRRRFATDTAASPSPSPSPSPSYSGGPVEVPQRAVLSVTGRDTIKLLQGLVTNNVTRLLPPSPSPVVETPPTMQYCAFLNPQGRMIATAFLHMLSSENVLVDTDATVMASLLVFIKKFKLRSKVQLVDVSDRYHVVAAWGGDGGDEPQGIAVGNTLAAGAVVAAGRDPRTAAMGMRGLVDRSGSGGSDGAARGGTAYTVHRMIQGVAETSDEIWENQALPLEANVDVMGGVDFRKGCYVGQELTARTHHTGVVRKRIVPVALYGAGPAGAAHPDAAAAAADSSTPAALAHDPAIAAAWLPAPGPPARGADVRSVPFATSDGGEQRSTRERSAGKLLSTADNVGLALLRLEQVARWGHDWHMRVALGGSGVQPQQVWLKPFVPAWWPDDVKNPS